jgi:hypothetical protein
MRYMDPNYVDGSKALEGMVRISTQGHVFVVRRGAPYAYESPRSSLLTGSDRSS